MGVGDHGQDAIDDYIAQHECNYICSAFIALKDCTRDEADGNHDEEAAEVDRLVSK
jgi:uncharacterized protein YutD